MSESSMDDTLKQAHELIEADELEQARALLEPLLESDPDNPDLWWVYAHAVEDAESGRNALAKVQELDPSYPGVVDLTERVEGAVTVDAAEFDDLMDGFDDEFDDTDAAAAALDDDFDDIEEAETAQQSQSRRSIGRLAAVAIVILFLVVVAGILLNGNDDSSEEPTPTSVVAAATETDGQVDSTEEPTEDVGSDSETEEPTEESEPTDEPTEAPTEEAEPTEVTTEEPEPTDDSAAVVTEEPEPTAVPATEEPTEVTTEEPEPTEAPTEEQPAEVLSAQAVQDALPDVALAGDGVENVESELGATTLVAVCTGGGKTSREILSDVMNLIVDQVDMIPDDSDAVGVRLVSCDDDRIINLIAVPIETVQAFKAGDLAEGDFLGQWRAIQQS